MLRAGTLAALGLVLAWLWLPGRERAAMGEVQLPAGPFVALTFDDGPKASTTPVLLDGLARRGVHATFFVIGENVAGNEELLIRMERDGHQIGLHTFHHKSLAAVNGRDFYAEVDKLRETLSGLLDQEDFMLRPPYGMITPSNRARAGSPIILWSVDPEDWKDHDVNRIVGHILSHVQDGDIILMHDIFNSSVDAALQAVDALQAQGYCFVTVEQLLEARGIRPQAGELYR